MTLAAGYITKVLIFEVPELTAHDFFSGEGSRWSVVAVVCAVVGGLAGTSGWLLAYRAQGGSSRSGFNVASVLGNLACSTLTLANAASAMNFLRETSGGCTRFVRSGAAAAMELKSSGASAGQQPPEIEWCPNPTAVAGGAS
eukprot:COSAG01_NODE_32677_length_577_cov_1.443515_1_plen_142_part_00